MIQCPDKVVSTSTGKEELADKKGQGDGERNSRIVLVEKHRIRLLLYFFAKAA